MKDVITLKANELGGMAALAKKLNWGSEKNPSAAFNKYVKKGVTPSLDFAVQWKKKLNENLIELIFEDEIQPIVSEAEEKYETLKDKYIRTLEELKECIKERDALKNLLETMKEKLN